MGLVDGAGSLLRGCGRMLGNGAEVLVGRKGIGLPRDYVHINL